MSQPAYSVIFRGDLVPGFTVADVKANMARLFKTAPQTIDKLFSGRPLAIRKGLGRAQAEQLQTALARIGAQTTLLEEGAPSAPPAPEATAAPGPRKAPAPQAQSGSDWSLAPMEGHLVKEHEREKKEPLRVPVDHLSLKPAGGQLVEDSERQSRPPVSVRVPDWQLDQ